MVLESLLSPLKAERKPWVMFFLGFLYTSVAVPLSYTIFAGQASLVMVFLIVLASAPIIYSAVKIEESKDLVFHSERTLIHEHNKAIFFILFLFGGITFGCAMWFAVLPDNMTNTVFKTQLDTYHSINSPTNHQTGQVTNHINYFSKIFFNNLKVLTFAIIFAFLFGVGAIFILTWNATVIGTAIGYLSTTTLSHYSQQGLLFWRNSLVHITAVGATKYLLHGIPEVMAYFYGGLAGSIISVSLIRKHYQSPHFKRILFDFSEIVVIAVGFLLVAAFLEVYVNPVLF